jgi:hypothetical protein
MIVLHGPEAPPVTNPVAGFTVAHTVLLLLHMPPDEPELNDVISPEHTVVMPVIAVGNAFTFIVAVAIQPVAAKVYVIRDVPALTPVATPPPAPGPGVIVATPVVALLQVPPGVASLNVVVEPTQTIVVPVIAAGSGFTVTVVVMEHPVPNV